MGCGSSKSENEKEIKSEMKECKFEKFDNFFNPGSALLEQAETLRSGLEDTLEEMYDITDMETAAVPNLEVAVQVWIWSCSAQSGGDIKKCKLSFGKESPFIDCDIGNLTIEVNKFKDNFRTYVATSFKCITELPSLIENIQSLVD